MNDSAPPPNGQAPVSWQDTGVAPIPLPGFNPRRAIGGQPPYPGGNPVMAPPPVPPAGRPAPYVSAPHGPAANMAAPYQGQPAHYAPTPHAAPPYPAHAPAPAPEAYPGATPANPGYAPDYYDPAYGGQPAYDYAQETVEPAGGRASLMSRLTGKVKREKAATPNEEPNGARKHFLMGLLVGIVLMLVLGQVFRAAQPSNDYAAMTPTMDETPYGDTEIVAFLDTVEGLN
jgi:hypothetical protein